MPRLKGVGLKCHDGCVYNRWENQKFGRYDTTVRQELLLHFPGEANGIYGIIEHYEINCGKDMVAGHIGADVPPAFLKRPLRREMA